MRLKFEDCGTCRFRKQRWTTCRDCDMGELYEDEDAPGVDAAFREAPMRFGESISTDETDEERGFDPNRFADTIEDQEGSEDEDA